MREWVQQKEAAHLIEFRKFKLLTAMCYADAATGTVCVKIFCADRPRFFEVFTRIPLREQYAW